MELKFGSHHGALTRKSGFNRTLNGIEIQVLFAASSLSYPF